jgi:DNA polymerase-3 subunit alpha
MHGEEIVEYRHPSMEPIFRETYGVPVYQEQLMSAAVTLAGYTPSEADDLRKAIAKKIKDKLEKHREKFVTGAVKHGIPQDTAQAIFADWEEFARYGFNKAHAADYGVIAVQTAYLKAYYPVEYMTALLTVFKGDTGKVAYYVADARRLGVEVKPPDVNSSGGDFTIEDEPNGKAAIRFGMEAIKNVGHGPVEAICKAQQQGGAFKDINDFARRVDLRHVGKRALESLIKVGALDRFGPRPALLASLDRILSASASHFKAADQGQLSLFGAAIGVMDEITLPKSSSEIGRREILSWERELIGLYVSDHPLSPVMNELSQAVSHFSGQLAEALHQERVRVAGLVTRVRPHTTKTGKAMGFVTLEDLQGTIELVVFPSTWEKHRELFDFDRIVLVDGKVDTGGAEPKVLVDTVTTEFTMLEPLPVTGVTGSGAFQPDAFTNTGLDEEAGSDEMPESTIAEKSTASYAPKPALAQAEPGSQLAATVTPNHGSRSHVPPPPETFPEDWERVEEVAPGGFILEDASTANKPVAQTAGSAQRVPDEPPQEALQAEASMQGAVFKITEDSSAFPDAMGGDRAVEPAHPPASTISNEPAPVEAPAAAVIGMVKAEEPAEVPKLLRYIPPPEVESDSVRMVMVTLRPTGDQLRDNLRMRQAYGTLISYPGNDRFAFRIFERGRSYQIEFPNFTTGLNPELLVRLQRLVGSDNIKVEQLTFQ